VEFRILGPLEVIHEERPIALGGNRERALLAILLLSANRVVSSERLAEDLWAGRPPEGANQALRVYVSRLRKSLREGGGEGVLVTQPPGYMTRVEPDALDATRFEALLAQGRDEAGTGDHHRAAATLRLGLSLWRGPALADLADAPFARAEAARLEETRLAALEERIEAELACGRHGELVAELDSLTRAHPLRERLWAQRMVALYRSGRQADALRAYQELRHLLNEELGLEPSAAVARLESAILRREPEVDWPPADRVAPPPRPGAPIEGVVTFLFTDLVGSTGWLERLGEDGAEELRRTHFSLLRQAVAEAGGQEVKNLGDGLMAAFASPLGALGCALAVQRSMAAHNQAHPERRLEVRVGLQAGEAVRAEDDFFGTAVVVAKRLCDRAEGGQILAGELVASLVGSRGDFRFRPLGPLVLKGLSVPVPAVDVAWPRPEDAVAWEPLGEAAGQIPLPVLLTGTSRIFVGRDQELEWLKLLWKEAGAGGERRLALLAGEPGIGKTRLAGELAAVVHAEGAVVLAGRCDEDLGVPYQPFVEALRQYVSAGGDLVTRLGRHGGELVRLVPEITERDRGLADPLRSDPETERYRLFDAVAAWLAAASAAAPVLLILDDLHWGAKPTQLLLRHVLRSPEPMRLLVVGTYRDTELSRTHPLTELLADLRRSAGVERIVLPGLDTPAVAAFLERAAGHDLADEGEQLARAVREETEGNPFFVIEVVRHLTETGAFEQRDGRWVTAGAIEELGIPEGVRDVVGRRLTRLSDAANQVLTVASVVGAEFEPAVVAAAGGLPEGELLAALDEAVAARLVREAPGPTPRYRFAHALVRVTLYDELSTARRVVLHGKVAGAIEAIHRNRLDDHLPALAHHYGRAAAPAAVTDKALEYAARAGDRALAQLAHDEAVVYYRQALELLGLAGGDEERRLDLLISLGEAQRRAGDPEHRQTLLGAAALATRTGDTGALARAALANHRGLHSSSRGVDAERVAVLEQALRALPQTDSIVRARLLATLASELTVSPEHARRYHLADEALAMARRLGDPSTLARVLVARLPALVWTADRAREMADFATLAGRIGDPALVFWAKSMAGMTSLTVGDVRTFTLDIDEAVRLADELGQPTMRWLATAVQAAARRLSGRLDDAERVARHALEIGEAAGHPDARHVYEHSSLFFVRYDQGRLIELVEACERHASGPSAPSQSVGNLGLAYVELGRLDEARAVLDRLAADHFAIINGAMSRLIELTVATEICAAVADRPRAETLHRLLAPHRGLIANRGSASTGPIDHHLALLETTLDRFDDADVSFVSAAAFHERLGVPAWLARTRLEWARMLLSREQPGDAGRARELLGQALATARELGLGAVEQRAAALLQ
jgi:DNA-binding SARP family transcriptional activator